ncbi:MAG: Crp/Fnr family transcriptional regulator [Proteobacteria bacterium]|nr:Crp/Fnr family transcriptional regulator [Pseudomonadota bacterium]
MNDLERVFRQIPLFSSLPPDVLGKLSQAVRPRSLKSGEVLFFKGDDGEAMYIIRKGTIKIVLPSSVGEEIIVALLKENDFFGAMAMLDGMPRSADAVSITSSDILVLGRSDFLSILQSDINALKTILCDLSRMIRKTDDLLGDVCFFNISVRLAKKLLELSETTGKKEQDSIVLDISLTQKELGDMVGATRESVNKELKNLREEGLIDIEGSRIRILDMEGLSLRTEDI